MGSVALLALPTAAFVATADQALQVYQGILAFMKATVLLACF